MSLRPVSERKREHLRVLAKAYREAKEKGLVRKVIIEPRKGN